MINLFDDILDLFEYLFTLDNDLINLFWILLIIQTTIYLTKKAIHG